MRELLIYLGDLVHNSVVKGPFNMPLNIGYIGAYTKKYFGNDVRIRLFKYPLQMINAIKEEPPHILALGNYSWNTDLNYKIIEFAKAYSKNVITVLGGPNFPIIEDEQADYLRKRHLVDYYVLYQGERGFFNLVKRILEGSDHSGKIRDVPINGCAFLHSETAKFILGKAAEAIESVDDIPSPYLSGFLDEFFDENLIPLIETDRGCPYTCTYCAWRKDRAVIPFGIERVKAEISYISKRVKNKDLLMMANANFGIFERDIEIAEYIKQSSMDSGYPRKLDVAWVKNTQKRVMDIAGILGDMVEITMSFQSLDEEVLKNIKRTNIEASTFMRARNQLAKKGTLSVSEVILGLPGETKESHLNTLRRLFDISADNIICYNLRTLRGSVLDTRQEREKYGLTTKFRLYDIGFGKYNDIISIEVDEVVRSTNTLSEEEVLFFRPVHWLIQFLWSYKYDIQLLKYLQSEQIHPVDFILRLLLDRKNAPAAVKELLCDFENDAKNEWFKTQKELIDYYSKEENFDVIMKGGFGKLNYKYMFRCLCENKKDFDKHLADTAKKMIDEKCVGKAGETAHKIVDNLIRYTLSLGVDFDGELDFVKEKKSRFDYDLLGWQNNNYDGALTNYHKPEGISYLFSMPEEQYHALKNNIKQFRHSDRNVTLRKMSEYMKKTDLFYTVSNIEN